MIGVEIVEEAVEAAKENAERNGLSNCEFIAGDVFEVLDDIKEKPDVIILDPPRDGIHPKALPKILDYGVDRIVYISCKMTSLARDLELIQQRGYTVEKMTAVDQFCETVHVETAVLLTRKLILCGVAGLFDGNVVVFLRKIKWISYRGSGDGVTLCEFNMWFIVRFSRGNRWGYISR